MNIEMHARAYSFSNQVQKQEKLAHIVLMLHVQSLEVLFVILKLCNSGFTLCPIPKGSD